MKEFQIKIWPEIESYLPAIIPFNNISEDKVNDLNIDFSNTIKINSSGSGILLVNLLKILTKKTSRGWNVKKAQNVQVDEFLHKLGLFSIIESYVPTQSLFWEQSPTNELNIPISQSNSDNYCILSYPIYHLDFRRFEKNNRRDCIQPFKDWLFEILKQPFIDYKFSRNNLIAILNELAKNSADHTNNNAFMGIDLISNKDTGMLKICFSFGDLGIGISENVRHHLKGTIDYKERAEKISLSDSYHYALSPGKTTKPLSQINKGIGMSIIFDVARAINLDLSVFDARSRGFLSKAKDRTHKELRKVFYTTGNFTGFYYYGELTVTKK